MFALRRSNSDILSCRDLILCSSLFFSVSKKSKSARILSAWSMFSSYKTVRLREFRLLSYSSPLGRISDGWPELHCWKSRVLFLKKSFILLSIFSEGSSPSCSSSLMILRVVNICRFLCSFFILQARFLIHNHRELSYLQYSQAC